MLRPLLIHRPSHGRSDARPTAEKLILTRSGKRPETLDHATGRTMGVFRSNRGHARLLRMMKARTLEEVRKHGADPSGSGGVWIERVVLKRLRGEEKVE